MTVKDHYDNHLGNFYSWYTGDFDKNKESFKAFCIENKIAVSHSGLAIDLGAGHGIQSVALAELGFKVKALDFNLQLLTELKERAKNLTIDVIDDDMKNVAFYKHFNPELIVCCGDTISHLESFDEIEKLVNDSYSILSKGGKLLFSFRDYSLELEDTNRFIPVKSDNTRIMTCFLEYFPQKIRVTDLLHELENGTWVQKVSSYLKCRVTKELIHKMLIKAGFSIDKEVNLNRIIHVIGEKI
jgi:2-polyprenyl-3-methyl-5-hydroxy-6-metoxy-1,4-benzoquinol methylase